MIAWLGRLFREERPATLLGLTRVAVALLLAWNTLKLARKLEQGYFADYFHLPLLPEAWVPSETVYIALLSLKLAGCLLAVIGWQPRAGLLAAALIGLYVIACDRLQYHNNHYVAHLVAFLLAFTPCHRSFLAIRAVRGERDRKATGPTWATALIKFQVSLVYLTSACSKLLDADWRGGEVMRLRYLVGVDVIRGRGYSVPDAVTELLGSPLFASLTSKAAIATELFLAFGLLLPRTRVVALWLGVLFHVGIQIFALVDLFSWLMLSVYVLYAVPELRERTLYFDPAEPRPRRVARLVRLCDWLLRYRVVPSAGAPLSIVDRDGHVVSGQRLAVALCRTLPILFPLWLPILMLASVATRRLPARSMAR